MISSTQGPLDGTINEFWQMVLQEEAETILMLCNCIETVRLPPALIHQKMFSFVMAMGRLTDRQESWERWTSASDAYAK